VSREDQKKTKLVRPGTGQKDSEASPYPDLQKKTPKSLVRKWLKWIAEQSLT
jgi:hypothetical protein